MVELLRAGSDLGPAVHRPLQGPLRLYIPYGGESTRSWLKEAAQSPRMPLRWEMSSPEHWVVGRAHLAPICVALAERYGSVAVLMDYFQAQVCGEHCRHSERRDCTCSCLGLTHGGPSQLNHLPIEDSAPLSAKAVRTLRRMTAVSP